MMNKESYIQNIPEELKAYNQWLWFKKILTIDKNGMDKIMKIPVSPITLNSKSWNQKESWSDFEMAVNNLENSGCEGLAFVLSDEDPFVCIDLDNIDNKKFDMFVHDFKDTYKEISLSCRGLHIFVKGKIEKNFNNQMEKVEMYQENKCIAMTGNILGFNGDASSTIIFKQNKIDEVYRLFSPKESIRKSIIQYQTAYDVVPNSDTVIEVMCRYNSKARALFEGTFTSGDLSKDDFSLLLFLNSFTHGNAEMMKDIFLKSALNRIDDKSKRRTENQYLRYLERSIMKAIQGGNRSYWDYNYHRNKGGYSLE